MYVLVLVVFQLTNNIFPTSAFSYTNFHVKKLQLCNNTQGAIQYHANISETDGDYYFDGFITVPMMLDETIGSSAKIDSKVGDQFVELFVIREKYFCKAANAHMGELWYDFERAAGGIPGLCPIPPKRYNVHHFLLNFHKISLQTVPFGTLRFTSKLIDNKNPESNLLCLVVEVDNVAN